MVDLVDDVKEWIENSHINIGKIAKITINVETLNKHDDETYTSTWSREFDTKDIANCNCVSCMKKKEKIYNQYELIEVPDRKGYVSCVRMGGKTYLRKYRDGLSEDPKFVKIGKNAYIRKEFSDVVVNDIKAKDKEAKDKEFYKGISDWGAKYTHFYGGYNHKPLY